MSSLFLKKLLKKKQKKELFIKNYYIFSASIILVSNCINKHQQSSIFTIVLNMTNS